MSTYIIWRVLLSIPALIGVTIVIFVALRVMPGDPVSVMFGTQATQIRPEDRAKIEADLGLSLGIPRGLLREAVGRALAAAPARGGGAPHAGTLRPALFFVATDVAGPW